MASVMSRQEFTIRTRHRPASSRHERTENGDLPREVAVRAGLTAHPAIEGRRARAVPSQRAPARVPRRIPHAARAAAKSDWPAAAPAGARSAARASPPPAAGCAARAGAGAVVAATGPLIARLGRPLAGADARRAPAGAPSPFRDRAPGDVGAAGQRVGVPAADEKADPVEARGLLPQPQAHSRVLAGRERPLARERGHVEGHVSTPA